MADFNWVDYVIIAILIFSTLAGFARGIVKELLSVLTWVIAFVVSSLFAGKLASVFTSTDAVKNAISDSSNAAAEPISMLALGLSFVSIFLVILIIGSLINYVISGAVDSVGLGVVNRLFGGFFGILRGFMINLVFIFIVQMTSFSQEPWWQQSKLVPTYQPGIDWISNLVDPTFDELKEKMSGKIEQTAQSLINNIYQNRA